MPITVQCECGHEITVSDTMAGKKGRCPKCDAILTIPAKETRGPKGGAHVRLPREAADRPYGHVALLSKVLSVAAFLLLLFSAGLGVFVGVSAFRAPETFQGALGLFTEMSDKVRDQPTLMGLAFIVGGILVGSLLFLFVSAAAQRLKLFVSIDRGIGGILRHLDGEPD